MEDEIIQKHNFEVAKDKILNESRKVPGDVTLQRFEVDGAFFSWNDHNITGAEANRLLVAPLQETLISQNDRIKGLLNIAHEVYVALDKLDTEYIAGIITAVKSSQTASDQAKTASEKAKKASSQALDASHDALKASKKASVAQEDIKITIQALQQAVNVLKNFKVEVTNKLATLASLPSQLNSLNHNLKSIEQSNESTNRIIKNVQSASTIICSLTHLRDIDVLWNDVEGHKTNLNGLHQQVDEFVAKVDEATTQITGNITALQEYQKLLTSYVHLADIDAIWNDVEGHKTNLNGLHQQVDEFVAKVDEATTQITGDITALQEYQKLLTSYVHLADIDAIWNDVEGHKTNLNGLHQQVDEFVAKVDEATTQITGDITALQEYQKLLTSYVHLADIDAIWNDVEDHKNEINNLQEATTRLSSDLQESCEKINKKFDDFVKLQKSQNNGFMKKNKIAYGVAGTSVLLSFTHLVLSILGII